MKLQDIEPPISISSDVTGLQSTLIVDRSRQTFSCNEQLTEQALTAVNRYLHNGWGDYFELELELKANKYRVTGRWEDYFIDSLYEMSNFSSQVTGLPPNTSLWVRTEPVTLPHVKYRIKIQHPQHGSAVFAIWGDEAKQVEGNWVVSGKDLKAIQSLIHNLSEQIRAHIDGTIDTSELIDVFKANKQ